MSIPDALLDVTFDQLRTLVVVKDAGSPRKAAVALTREQSSVLKQIESLNKYFERVCGQVLAHKRSRGEDYAFTETGVAVAAMAQELFGEWTQKCAEQRRVVGRRLVIGTTLFTLRILDKVWSQLVERVDRSDVELQVEQTRTKDFWDRLLSRRVDLILGGRVIDPVSGKPTWENEFDFLEWDRDDICLLTNLEGHQVRGTIAASDLARLHSPVIMPSRGVIVEMVREVYGPNYSRDLNLAPPIDDVFYGIDLLRCGIVHGFMFTTSKAALAALRATNSPWDTGEPTRAMQLRQVQLGSGFTKRQVVTGLFGRIGERDQYRQLNPAHPLSIFWEIFEAARKPARSC